MRKIMVILMVMALLVGMMTICPMAASENLYFKEEFEEFNDSGLPSGWTKRAETTGTVEPAQDGVQLIGNSATSITKIQREVKIKAHRTFVVRANVTLSNHTEGTGLRFFYNRDWQEVASPKIWGSSGYYTQNGNINNVLFRAHCDYNGTDGLDNGFILIEYVGNGSATIHSIEIEEVSDVINGDFEGNAGTPESNKHYPDGWFVGAGKSVGKTSVDNTNCIGVGNGVDATTSSDFVYLNYGIPVTKGGEYRLSFSYKNANKVAPRVYIYCSETEGTGWTELVDTELPKWSYPKPATDGWTDYSYTFTLTPTGDQNIIWLHQIGLRGVSGTAISYYDNFEFTKAEEPRVSFVDGTNNTIVSEIEAGKTAYARVSYTHDTEIAEGSSASVTAIGAVYTEKDGKKQLVSVDVKTATLTEDIHAELRPVLSASAEATGKLWAEVYVLDSVKGLTPIMEKTALK